MLCVKSKDTAYKSVYTYSKRRIHHGLKTGGVSVSLAKVAKLMKRLGIVVKFPKKKHDYPDSGEVSIYALNLLKRQFNPEEHNTHWVTDVTYIRFHQGWRYLACVLHLATK